jgi:hypothetical protein
MDNEHNVGTNITNTTNTASIGIGSGNVPVFGYGMSIDQNGIQYQYTSPIPLPDGSFTYMSLEEINDKFNEIHLEIKNMEKILTLLYKELLETRKELKKIQKEK